MKPTLLILAAGLGSRYGGDKQVDGFGPNGETILEYSMLDALRAGFGKVVFIVREEILEMAREMFLPKLKGKAEVEFVVQSLDSLVPDKFKNPERKKPYGTAHALLCAHEAIEGPFAVINADDFYGREAFEALASFLSHEVRENLHCMVGYAIQDVLSTYGTVSRGVCEADPNGNLIGMIERTSISKKGDNIIHEEGEDQVEIAFNTPVSMNCWGFHPSIFKETHAMWQAFLEKRGKELKSEFYIPTVANHLIEEGRANVKILKGGKIWFGVTYTEDKPTVIDSLKKLHASGVYPGKLW
ncbi:nucleotidyltransferase family protein [Pleomorphovibrio marinus]|uniref:nucleotidyltransferase family protein n=1 Tax=Pleomorphovibrio marinus TaxID=2164132 RepID=UPI000E0C9F7D|nr:sugar phosphate nucleotidyltransferase [Pleomorphovibrio marinus]